MRFRPAIMLLACATMIGMTGCSNATTTPNTTTPDAATTPSGETPRAVTIVASTNVWGSIAKEVGGDAVDVQSIITQPTQDPHGYQATAQDKLIFSKAKLVLMNGGGYDDWAKTLAESVNPAPVIINAVDVSGLRPADDHDEHAHTEEHEDDHDHEDGHHHHHGDFNEHVFYSLDTAKKVADSVATQIATLDPSLKAKVEANAQAFNSKIDMLIGKAKKVGADHPGLAAVATEPVAGYLLETMGVKDITPPEFVEQSETDAGPSVQLVNETVGLISDKKAGLLLLNGQTEDAVSQKLQQAADTAHVPVAKVYETFPAGVDNYLDFMGQAIDSLSAAVNK